MKSNTTKMISIILAALFLVCLIPASAADGDFAVTVVTAQAGNYADFSDIPINASGDYLFGGWYTSENAAASLDKSRKIASPDFSGTAYGAVIALDGTEMQLIGAQMRTDTPSGIRFISTINKQMIDVVESLNALNCKGKNGTLNPANETSTGIGYGTVLAISVDVAGELEKEAGNTVRDGMTVPGVYVYDENETTLSFTATVIGVDTASLADKVSARPYVTYADANGTVRTVYYTENGTESGAYSASVYALANAVQNDETATEAAKTAASTLLTSYRGGAGAVRTSINALNTYSESGSADLGNAYVELDRSTYKVLSSLDGSGTRYDKAAYSRTLKVKDNLYLLFYHYGDQGQHLYCVTSSDGYTWNAPSVFYNSANNKFTYTYGSLAGTEDRYYAVNADAVLLDNGQILVIYSRRPCSGYQTNEYTALNTIELVRGTVSGNVVQWSDPTTIYHGHSWEGEIIQRDNGQIDVYFTHIAPIIDIYGWSSEKRSSGVGMISSTDNGYTWTPNVTANDTNHYAATRVMQEYVWQKTFENGDVVNFYSAQMPGVVELYDGSMFMAAETETISGTDKSYHLSFAKSGVNGVWSNLGIDEEGPATLQKDLIDASAPSLAIFDSGEVLLAYNSGNSGKVRVLNKNASNITSATEVNILAPALDYSTNGGCWAGVSTLDSHTAMFSMHLYTHNSTSTRAIVLGRVRLNHTINATHKNVIADGNPQEWANTNEALFVGSSTAAQATYRFAYDEENVYILIDRADSSNNSADTQYVMLSGSSEPVTVSVDYATGTTVPDGVTFSNRTASGGRVYEIAVDRATFGLTGSSIRVCPGLTDGGVDDIIDGVNKADVSTWLKINLQ